MSVYCLSKGTIMSNKYNKQPQFKSTRDRFFLDMINKKSGGHTDKKKAKNKKACRGKKIYIGDQCNWFNTLDFESVIEGSSPSSPTILKKHLDIFNQI